MLASAARIPATDEGLIRGDGVFEVIRLYGGRTFALEEHLQRMERSALNLRLPVDLEAIRADIGRLLAHVGSGPEHELLRVVVTRGGRRLLMTEALPPSPEHIRLGSITYQPTLVLDGVKSLSYAANMLASRLARERGFDDALLVSPGRAVVWSPRPSSFFWVRDGEVFTPPLSEHILASITRRMAMEAAVLERSVTLEEVCEADEAFIASTARETQPVAKLWTTARFTAPGPGHLTGPKAVMARINASLDGTQPGIPQPGRAASGPSS